jgi:hypothetical protein
MARIAPGREAGRIARVRLERLADAFTCLRRVRHASSASSKSGIAGAVRRTSGGI